MNKAELGALQLEEEELRIAFEKRHEEMQEHVGLVRKGWKKEVPSEAKEDPLPVSAWKLLYA